MIQRSAQAQNRISAAQLLAQLPHGSARWQGDTTKLHLCSADFGVINPQHPPAICVLGHAGLAWLAATTSEPLRAAYRAATRAWVLPEGISLPPDWCGGAPVLQLQLPEADSMRSLRLAAAEAAAASATVHGVMVNIQGIGVLISGRSGVGKSELALELLARGHRLVADDAVELLRPLPDSHPELIIGRCPPLLQDFLEVRGLGILDVARMYGRQAVLRRQRLDLIITLRQAADAKPDYVERLEGLRSQRDVLGCRLPQISLPVAVGHNLGTLAEAACRDHWLRVGGYRADAEFAHRQQLAIDQKGPH